MQKPSRPEVPTVYLPGNQVFFYRTAGKSKKGRLSRSTTACWEGPAVVFGHEWEDGEQRNSYWIRSAGRCRLVPGENLRFATMEGCLSQEQLLAELEGSVKQLGAERKPLSLTT